MLCLVPIAGNRLITNRSVLNNLTLFFITKIFLKTSYEKLDFKIDRILYE